MSGISEAKRWTETCRLTLMNLKVMNHWLWICEVWERGRYGSMDRVSGDIGWLLQMGTAIRAVIPGLFGLQSANLVVVNQHKDGT